MVEDADDLWIPPVIFYKGETVVIIGGGPSLTQEDVDYCQGRARAIAVNDAYRMAPWADVLYGCDRKWWGWHDGVPDFQGYKVALETCPYPEVRLLRHTGPEGFDTDRSSLRTISNSGGQAIQLAVKMGARRLVLLGFDMKIGAGGNVHWFGDHPVPTKHTVFRNAMLPKFASLKAALDGMGIEVINATPDSALTIWPLRALRDAL